MFRNTTMKKFAVKLFSLMLFSSVQAFQMPHGRGVGRKVVQKVEVSDVMSTAGTSLFVAVGGAFALYGGYSLINGAYKGEQVRFTRLSRQ